MTGDAKRTDEAAVEAAPGSPGPVEISCTVEGLRLAARAWGPADGPPVLALHGWLDNAASFDRLAPLLPEVRLVALDLPGHGLSQHLAPHAAYDFVDWIGWIALVKQHFGWQQLSLLGHSMGASIAAMFAGAFPDQVQRLALVEGLGPEVATAEEMPGRVAAAAMRRCRREAVALLAGTKIRPYPSRDAMAGTLCAALRTLSLEAARTLVARGSKEVEGGFTWRADARLRGPSPMRFTEEQVRVLLRRIRAPTLVIRASNGWPLEAATVTGRLACLSDLRVMELQGGHHVHLDDAGAVATAVLPFLCAARSPAA